MNQVSESNSRWWDIREAAAYLRVSIAFIRKQIRLGRFPYARAGSKNLRFQKTQLDEWMKAKK